MANDRTVTGAGFQLIISSGSLSKSISSAVEKGLELVGEQYKKELVKVVSLDDHTLAELRALGYPYSTNQAEDSLHDDREVHEQTGLLKRSISVTEVEETTSRRFSVFAMSDAPYMQYLIFGTSRMRPRRFHELAMENIKDKFWNPVLELLRKVESRLKTAEKLGE